MKVNRECVLLSNKIFELPARMRIVLTALTYLIDLAFDYQTCEIRD